MSIPAGAQFGGPAPVKYAEAIERQVRSGLELSGSVESRRSSLVAAEVEGVVVALAARQGDRVERGQPLVRQRQRPTELRLQAARGELDEARARLRLAEASRSRAEELFADKVISVQQLDDAVSEYEARLGRVAQLEAVVARLEDDLANATVRAPFTGVVAREHTALGEWLSAGDPVVELVDNLTLEVAVEVPEQYFRGLEPGSPVPVRFDALQRFEIEGTLRAVVPRANPQARTFPAKIDIPNPDGLIGVGMLARVSLPVGDPRPAVMVPKDAVVSQGPQRLVFTIDAEDKAQPMPVEVGAAADAWIAVAGGVKAGDRVVVRGNERLRPGQELAPEPLEIEAP